MTYVLLLINYFADIIALLVVGVICLVLFVLWQRYLERVQDNPELAYSQWTPPPLMRLSVWGRANGRLAVMLVIAFFDWSGFLSWNFWVQVNLSSAKINHVPLLNKPHLAVLPKLHALVPNTHHDPTTTNVCHWPHL